MNTKSQPKTAQNSGCGFVVSVLSYQESDIPNSHKACGDFQTVQKARLFLISDYSNTSKRKIKTRSQSSKIYKPKNRKKISYSGSIRHDGIVYQVNSSNKRGIFLTPLHKAIEQLEICRQKWGRVLLIRFDLHQGHYTKDSCHISKFVKNFKDRLERAYGLSEIGYFWARENERAKYQHYHFAIMLDGNKVRHSSKVLRIVRNTWKAKQHRHVPTIKNPYYFIDNGKTKADAIYRISYLAKSRGKGYRDKQNKDYSTSRLTPNQR